MYVCMYVCMYVRMYVCTYVRMYVCTYVRMYVCTYVRMYVCTYERMNVFLNIYKLWNHEFSGMAGMSNWDIRNAWLQPCRKRRAYFVLTACGRVVLGESSLHETQLAALALFQMQISSDCKPKQRNFKDSEAETWSTFVVEIFNLMWMNWGHGLIHFSQTKPLSSLYIYTIYIYIHIFLDVAVSRNNKAFNPLNSKLDGCSTTPPWRPPWRIRLK